MNSLKLSGILKHVTFATFILTAIGSGICLLASALAAFDVLPAKFYASYEVPIELHKLNEYYDLTELSAAYDDVYIEVKKANLELKSKSSNISQVSMFLYGGLYMAFWACFIFLLYRILTSINSASAFAAKNYKRIRNLGIMVIVYSLFEPFFGLIFRLGLKDLEQHIPDFIEIQNLRISLDFTEIFLGLLLIVLAEVFRQGYELKTLEEQTI